MPRDFPDQHAGTIRCVTPEQQAELDERYAQHLGEKREAELAKREAARQKEEERRAAARRKEEERKETARRREEERKEAARRAREAKEAAIRQKEQERREAELKRKQAQEAAARQKVSDQLKQALEKDRAAQLQKQQASQENLPQLNAQIRDACGSLRLQALGRGGNPATAPGSVWCAQNGFPLTAAPPVTGPLAVPPTMKNPVPMGSPTFSMTHCQLQEIASGGDPQRAKSTCDTRYRETAAGRAGGPPPAGLTAEQLEYLTRNAVSLQPEQRTIAQPSKAPGGEQVPRADSTFICGTPPNQYPCPTIVPPPGDSTATAKQPSEDTSETRGPFAPATPEQIEAQRKAEAEKVRKETEASVRQAQRLRVEYNHEDCKLPLLGTCPNLASTAWGRWCDVCDRRRYCDKSNFGRDKNCSEWETFNCRRICK
jgi:actin-related protein